MQDNGYYEIYNKFVEELKSSINICEFYTKLTGNEFTKYDGRLRAKIAWRDDKNPSLSKVPGKELLTDFTESNSKTGKPIVYDVIDLLLKCGKAADRWHAIQLASTYANKKKAFEELAEQSPATKKQKYDKKAEFAGNPKLGEAIYQFWDICKKTCNRM